MPGEGYNPDREKCRVVLRNRRPLQERLNAQATEAFRWCLCHGADEDRARNLIGSLVLACKTLQHFGMRHRIGGPSRCMTQEAKERRFAELQAELALAINDLLLLNEVIHVRSGGSQEVAPVLGTESASPPIPPPSETQLKVLEVIQSLPPERGISGKDIIKELKKAGFPIEQSTLTRHIIPDLKKWHGVKNVRRRGYFIPPT